MRSSYNFVLRGMKQFIPQNSTQILHNAEYNYTLRMMGLFVGLKRALLAFKAA